MRSLFFCMPRVFAASSPGAPDRVLAETPCPAAVCGFAACRRPERGELLVMRFFVKQTRIAGRRYAGRILGLVVGLLAGLIIVGCRAGIPPRWQPGPEAAGLRSEIVTVPFFPQEAYQCGPAALAMALGWSGRPVEPDRLTAEVFTPSRRGSLQAAMVGAARRHGRVAYLISNPSDLMAELAAGHPVVVLQNLGLSWFPVWHYAVVIGYDLPRDTVTLHSGAMSGLHQPLRVFDRTWARSDYWGLLVLPPSRLPATAQEQAYVAAVLGLEKSRMWRDAVVGYRTALSRWPGNRYARMGLGNSYYGLEDYGAAEAVFQEVIRRFPGDGSAFNNLAQVLWRQGRTAEALAAARQAVALGGPLVDIYRRTLDEIRSAPP